MPINIQNISWTRTYINVDYTATDGDELVLYRAASHEFKYFGVSSADDSSGESKVRSYFNVVIANGREPLAAGDWYLCTKIPDELLNDEERLFSERPWLKEQAVHWGRRKLPSDIKSDDDLVKQALAGHEIDVIREHPYDLHLISYAPEVLFGLESLSEAFRYAKGEYMYTATFIPRTDRTDYPYVVLCMGFYVRNRTPRVRKHSVRWKEKQILAKTANAFSRMSHRTGKRVLFFKQNGDVPTGNMQAVRDRMYERGLDKEFVIEERYRNTFERGRQSLGDWLSDIKAISRADYIFVDDYCPIFNFVELDDGVVLTQIWHAGVGFKSVGYARFGITGSPDPYDSCHRRYTYALVGNKYLRKIYSEVFGIEEEALLATGMPRLDHFFDEEGIRSAREKLLAAYDWMSKGRVIMFAPTFRGSGQRTAYYPYDSFLDMEKLYEMCERTNSYFVFEMHHFIDERPEIPPEFSSRLKDLSDESLDELYHVTDVLVTDYSSCFYDYLLLQKPVVFYTPDRVSYSATRGVQRPVDKMAPGIVCDTFDEFVGVLESGSYSDADPDPSCLDRALEHSGLASDRVIDTILLHKDVPGVRFEDRQNN
ncbi:MAG: CDP-glycerol glycerophosphotransferase family protein [Coriobacteriales bacterium]|jgi:CDP-ribitol ribitolphosphotransferase